MKQTLHGILIGVLATVIGGIILNNISTFSHIVLTFLRENWRPIGFLLASCVLTWISIDGIAQTAMAKKHPETQKYLPKKEVMLLFIGWLLWATTYSYMSDYLQLLKK